MIRLTELRKANNLSQNQLAKNLNISQQVLSRYEREEREPDYKSLIKIANYFDVSIDYLLGNSDYYYPDKLANNQSAIESVGDGLSNEEREIIKKYRELNVHGKKLVNTAIDTYLATMAESREKHFTNQNKF